MLYEIWPYCLWSGWLWSAGLAPLRNSGVDRHGRGPTQRALAAEREKREAMDVTKANQCRCPNVSSTRLVSILSFALLQAPRKYTMSLIL